LDIYVIAIDSVPRNKNLLTQLALCFPTVQIRVLDAVIPQSFDRVQMEKHLDRAKLLLGRKVTPLEIAVMLSHRKCMELSETASDKAILVFEDDASIDQVSSFVAALMTIPKSTSPSIWSLYSPEWGIWKMKKGQWSGIIPPAFAVAYLANFGAMTIALRRESTGLADWPDWSRFVNFFYVPNSSVTVKGEHSYVEINRATAKKERNRIWSLLDLCNVSQVKYIDRIRHIIIFPLQWKYHKIIQVITGRRTMHNNSSIFLGKS
jgi:GR25 family glycosyltransferase involved in LPS biosynthesis